MRRIATDVRQNGITIVRNDFTRQYISTSL